MSRQRKTGPESKITRRRLLQGSAAAAALGGVVTLAGCNKRRDTPASQDGEGAAAGAAIPDLRQSLTALLLALGPWRAEQAGVAEHFLDRFVTAERLRGYEDAAPQIAAVAARIPAGARALGAIDLGPFPAPERQALLRVLHDLYGIQEVRFFLAGQPPPGACVGDLEAFLTAPGEG
jgi:hypothetical protein